MKNSGSAAILYYVCIVAHMKYTPEQAQTFYQQTKEFLKTDLKEDQIEDLKNLIRFHEWKYYIQNDPIISDFEYDQLFDKLKNLEMANPDLVSLDSPTQRVSTDLTESFDSVKHLSPMLSLDNSYNAQDLYDFEKQVRKLCGLDEDYAISYSVEPKFDGGSIAVVYEDDILVRAATRGNGTEGEEMTNNARVISTLPLTAEFSGYGIKKVELRGEAVIGKDQFRKINEKRLKEGKALLANPRNSAAGGLRTKDPAETRERYIEVFIFSMSYAVNEKDADMLEQFGSHSKAIEILSKQGFKVPEKESMVCENIEEVLRFALEWEQKRDRFPYEIDGMVIKVNNFDLQALCGSTSHHPRWAVAFKFKAKQASTKLLDIVYQVGKIGSITPVAKLEPVQLAGVTVSSVSLHNEEFIRSKDLRLLDTVLIERAGDVIPYVVKAMEELRTGKEQIIDFPVECPVNGTGTPIALVKNENEAAWRCPLCICGAQDLQRMIFHVSKDAMDIDGFGKSYVEKFYELGWIRDISDLYKLDYDKIAELEGFGTKSAENLKFSIDRAKQNPIHRLLHSLSIHHLGKRASRLIAEQIGHVLELSNWSAEDFTGIKDIGPVVAENVAAYFALDSNISMLQRMEDRGVNLHQTEDDKPLEIADDAPLQGKTILFTGTLQHMGRKEAQSIAEKAGAKNISAVSKNLDILVVGENAGSKLTKAQNLETVQIMTEEEFLELIR